MDVSLEVKVGQALARTTKKLITAESCTGGLVGHWLTNVPGSSEYYLGGVISYANQVKHSLLHVPQELLDQHGAVSEAVVLSMARGARDLLADEYDPTSLIGLSISGVAGPGGGTPGKPVGLVWIGLAAQNFERAWSFVWSGDREANKDQSARQALRLLIDYLEDAV